MNRKVSIEQEKEICSLYLEGRSIKSIANLYGLSWAQSVTEIAKRNKIPLRRQGAPRIISYDINFFKGLAEETIYWAGFIAADGCVIKKGNSHYLSIALGKKDLDHLKKFKKAIKTNAKISEQTNSYRIVICIEDSTVNDLLKFNIYPRKSLSLCPPDFLSDDQKKWFIRGYFDGDGSIYTPSSRNYSLISFIGTENIINFIKDTIGSQLNIEMKTYKRSYTSVYDVKCNSKKDTLDILTWLYKDADYSCRLDRKYKKSSVGKEIV